MIEYNVTLHISKKEKDYLEERMKNDGSSPEIWIKKAICAFSDGLLFCGDDARRRYRRSFRYWGEFCSGRKSRFAENKAIIEKYAEFVKYQQGKHYSMDTILKTCQIVDKIKMKNEFDDKDILKTDSDKFCETITGRRYTQCSDRFLNNVIRKYQAYLQECEA